MGGVVLGVLALTWVAAPAAQGAAEGANPHLQEAERLYAQLRYAEAAHALELAMAVPGNTVAQQRRIFELQGTVQLILHNRSAAYDAFYRLLDVDPDFRFDASASPKIRAFFDEVREDHVPLQRVSFEEPPRELRPARGPPLIAVYPTRQGAGTIEVVLRLRARPGAPFDELPMAAQADGGYRAALPPEAVEAAAGSGRLEYLVEARNAQGRVVGRAGSEEQPFLLEQLQASTGEDGQPWYTQWWVWTAAGVALGTAAAVTTVVLVVGRPSEEPGHESLGTHTLD